MTAGAPRRMAEGGGECNSTAWGQGCYAAAGGGHARYGTALNGAGGGRDETTRREGPGEFTVTRRPGRSIYADDFAKSSRHSQDPANPVPPFACNISTKAIFHASAPPPPPKAYTKHPNEAIKMDPANSRSRRDKRYRIIERAEKRVQGVQTGPPTTRSPIETTPTLFSLLRSPLPRRTPREASFAPGFKGRERYKFMQRRVPRGNIYNRDPPASMNF